MTSTARRRKNAARHLVSGPGLYSQAEWDNGSLATIRRPVRVAIIGPSLDILGGQSVQAARLLERLQSEPGLEMSFVAVNPRLPGVLGYLQKIKYVRTVVTSIAYIATLLWKVPHYDVLHIFSASYWSFLLAPTPAILIGRLYGRKTVLNYHSGEAEDHLSRWPSAVKTLRLADKIVVPSNYLVGVLAKWDFSTQAIFNFVDFSRFRFRERNPLRPVFLSNRNMMPMYNVGVILRAFGLIQKRYPDAVLTVAGDGPERPMLEELARELHSGNTTFTGQVSNAEMPGLYDAADIYLNSSEIDNMPLSIIEAYACGTPVVTTDAGGIPYMLKHEGTGLLVPQRNPEALAAAALRLLDEPDLAASIVANALAECRQYTWEATRQQWVDLYTGLAHP
jgi:glycosyltransferase involved in cell wall biosynthesis